MQVLDQKFGEQTNHPDRNFFVLRTTLNNMIFVQSHDFKLNQVTLWQSLRFLRGRSSTLASTRSINENIKFMRL